LGNASPIFEILDTSKLGFQACVEHAQAASGLHGDAMKAAVCWAVKDTKARAEKGTLGPLTADQAAAIHLYSQPSPFYVNLNRLLREENRTLLQPYFPFIRLFMSALRQIPPQKARLNRGITLNLTKDYKEEETVIWWAVTSATSDISVLEDPTFLGVSGERTQFDLTVFCARNIAPYSALPKESELIILPGTCFKVQLVMQSPGGLTMVKLVEEVGAPPMIPTGAAGSDDLPEASEGFYDVLDPQAEDFYDIMDPDNDYNLTADGGGEATYGEVVAFGGGGGGVGGGAVTHVHETAEALYADSTAASAGAATQCTRPNPNGGFCKNKRLGASQFCKGHSCPTVGCVAGKSSSEPVCAAALAAAQSKHGGKASMVYWFQTASPSDLLKLH